MRVLLWSGRVGKHKVAVFQRVYEDDCGEWLGLKFCEIDGWEQPYTRLRQLLRRHGKHRLMKRLGVPTR